MRQHYIYFFLVFLGSVFQKNSFAQSTYVSSNYAVSGDTLYLTKTQVSVTNFDTSGAGLTLDYSALSGVSQRRLIFRAPNQTGFSIAQWPYIFNASNVNLSSTDDKTFSTANLQYTDPNDYYLKNTSLLEQKASSAKITVGSTSVNVKNVYATSDVLLKFPLNYGNVDSSEASFTTNIPNLYYRSTTIKRVNRITGWGSVTTPYGTFSNCLKLESTVREIDTVSIDTVGFPQDTLYYREIKWFDSSKKYEILYVKQNKIGNMYVTQTVEYLDNKQFFQPIALFAYLPLAPIVNDTVTFQNLSTNSYSYSWDFDDPASGANNTSNVTNPLHIFNTPGVFQVMLIATNGPLLDTVIIPVSVATIPSASFTYSPSTIFEGDTVFYTNTSINAAVYKWNFGDPLSGIKDTSFLADPKHVYAVAGTYSVVLIAYSSAGADTAYASILVDPAIVSSLTENDPVNNLTLFPNPSNGEVCIQATTDGVYSIINELGQTIRSFTLNVGNNYTLKIENLSNGIYFIVGFSNNKMSRQKMVIEK
ncbi:MAG: hypothetical protein A3F72_10530 [Bacteroidetes bacterium RIFCSPLOWO2_12_FULL_35_15]|nr:MAG: hypothetical protein A3F72_10530 [Bacteroidetes bacterium RIFCSPLOWO2_12_FULL_35_15]